MSKSPPALEDYDAIEAAVRQTERGRWFLQEFARRNRAADTGQILDALAGLEARMHAPALSLEPTEPLPDDEPAPVSALLDRSADARAVATVMPAPPSEAEPAEPEVAELTITPPLDDAPADLDLESDAPVPVEAPPPPRLSATRMRVEAELADLAGLRASLSRSDALPQPTRPSPARQVPLLESLSDAEKALLFA